MDERKDWTHRKEKEKRKEKNTSSRALLGVCVYRKWMREKIGHIGKEKEKEKRKIVNEKIYKFHILLAT